MQVSWNRSSSWIAVWPLCANSGHPPQPSRGRNVRRAFAGEHADEDVKVELLSDIRHVFGALADDQIAAEVLL